MPPKGSQPDPEVLEDDSSGFRGGGEDPGLNLSGFKHERRSSTCSVTEMGSSSEDPSEDGDDASVSSFQSAQMDMEESSSGRDDEDDLDASTKNVSDDDTTSSPTSVVTGMPGGISSSETSRPEEDEQSTGQSSCSKERKARRKTPSRQSSRGVERSESYKRDHPSPLKDDSERDGGVEDLQIVPYEAGEDDEEELQIVSYDPLKQPSKHTIT